MYKEFGRQNGLYLTPAEEREWAEKARPFLTKHGLEVGAATEELSAADRKAGLGESLDAAKKLKYNRFYRGMTNFDAFFYQTEAERLPQAVTARKGFFQAERLYRSEAAPEQAVAVYEATIPIWLDLLLGHPDFSRISTIQEETYETQMRYLRRLQDQRDAILRPLVTGMAQLGMRLPVPLHLAPTYPDERTKIIPIRKIRGPLEMAYVLDKPEVGYLREVLFDLTRQAVRPPLFVSPQLEPWIKDHTLVVFKSREPEGKKTHGWRPLIDDEVIRQVRLRMGIERPPQAEPPPAPHPQARKR
jgi:hypothetical protein